MNKVPRFVKEYANYQKSIAKELPNKEAAVKIEKQINRALSCAEHGLITVNEAMESINNCFKTV